MVRIYPLDLCLEGRFIPWACGHLGLLNEIVKMGACAKALCLPMIKFQEMRQSMKLE